MKRLVLYTFGVAAATAAFVYLLSDPVQTPEAVPLLSAPVSADTTADLPAIPAAPVAALQANERVVDFEATKRRLGVTYDPMLVMALGDFTDEEIDAYNALHVIPFNRVIGTDCEERPDPQIPSQMFETCRTVREFPEHPYSQLPDAELRDLAVHDAAASLMLGRRTVVEEERLYWYLRAAALAEKSGPLMALAERRYGSPYKLQSRDGRLVPVPQTDTVVKRLALETVAAKLGDPRANPERWRASLVEIAGEQSAAELERADRLVAEFLVHMATTQREITGSVQIQELIDA